jgi:hypothetical protein
MRSAMRCVLITSLLLLAGSSSSCCYDCDDDDCCDGGNPPTFLETEPNDDPSTADHFGTVYAGDRFFIEGFIQGGLLDPFDGFSFTAGQPIHVDFQLFIDDAFSDLDVCLYDPQLATTVACFATDQNPERGGVEVDFAGLDFQLVVEPFAGASSYTLEIDVQPPVAASSARDAGRPGIRGSEGLSLPGHVSPAQHGWGEPLEESRARPLRIEQEIEVDLERGVEIVFVRVARS